VGPRAGLDGRKISSPPGFDSGPSSPWSVAIPTELPGTHNAHNANSMNYKLLLILFITFTHCTYNYIQYFKRTTFQDYVTCGAYV